MIRKMDLRKIVLVIILLLLSTFRAEAKDYKITVVTGHPPVFLWVTLTRDFFIPEVDRRLLSMGGKHRIVWNQAYGGTIARIGGVLEAIEDGIADMGFVGTLFEAPKMPLHNVSYMTPFGSGNIDHVVDTMKVLEEKIPALKQEWTRHNQVCLGGAALDSYGILSRFPIHSVSDLKGHKLAAPGPSANWLKGTSGVAVAANLNTYYNGIKTGVFDGTLTFMTAASAIKIHEVARHITITGFGAQFAGGLSINRDVFESFPPEVQEVFLEVGQLWSRKLARAQAEKAEKSLESMQASGAIVSVLSMDERRAWAEAMPNVPMNWVSSMEEKKLPGREMLEGYLEGLRKHGARLPRDWDR